MAKKSFSRVDAEKAEQMPEVKNEVPENRLQSEQQVAEVDSAEKAKPIDSSFTAKRAKAKGSTLKQSAIADAITGSSGTAGMGINAAGRGVSGTAGGILGASNSTAVAGQSRSASRVGKKLDRIATKLNYTPCEQVIVEVDESKPLADAADEDQGYNGTYRNESARSQKIMGAVPGDLMFQRSVDEIIKDKLYFVEGQQVFQGDDRVSMNPSKNYNDETTDYEDIEIKSGNYLHTGMHVGLSETGKVRSLFFDVEDLTPSALTADDANVASAHRLIKENVAELDRISMDAKAGDEKADIWTPLARAIKEPTQMSYFLSSVEAETGAYVHLAYSKATTNFSYQLNRAAKDGLDVVTPAIEQCVGWRSVTTDGVSLNAAYDNSLHSSEHKIFDKSNYVLGDPTIMIAAYDSIGKYNNKADLLLQPRGYRMHLQTADNNMNPLRVPAEYAVVFAGQECFSTIDHEYDPIMPICMTDKANLITVHNFNELSAFIKSEYDIGIAATEIKATYKYKNVTLIPKGFQKAAAYENLYIYVWKTEGTDGLKYTSGTGVVECDPDSSDANRVIKIRILSRALTSDELGEGGDYEDYTLLATVAANASNDIVLHLPVVQSYDSTVITAVSFFEGDALLKHSKCGHLRYRYSDLRNSYNVTVKHPLVEGIVEYLNESMGGKFRSLLEQEEFFIPLIFSTQFMTLAQLIICAATPWIARVRLNTMKDVIYYEDNIHEYPFQKLASLKEIPFKNYVNFGFSNYDEPLQTKIMNPVTAIQWVMPEFFWKIGTEKYVAPWYFSENDFNSDGSVKSDASNMSMPSIRSGIRLGSLDTLYGMSERDIRLSLDRITKTFFRSDKISSVGVYKYGRTTDGQPFFVLSNGQVISVFDILSAPRELGLCMDAPLGVLTKDPADSGAYKSMSADGTSTSFRIKVWLNNNTILHPSILSAAGVNINRAANYSQKWVELYANLATSNTDIAGLVFGLNDEGSAEFTPFASLSDGSVLDSAPTLTSLQRSLWTRVQLLPFVISPFDAVVSSGPSYSRDIYDIAYMFGLCGFRASDYRESAYNREKEVINQGITFVEDPWVIDSPIVKHGSSSTGQSITKGYELRSSN
jgi:hypothetical protein